MNKEDFALAMSKLLHEGISLRRPIDKYTKEELLCMLQFHQSISMGIVISILAELRLREEK